MRQLPPAAAPEPQLVRRLAGTVLPPPDRTRSGLLLALLVVVLGVFLALLVSLIVAVLAFGLRSAVT